MSVQYKLVRTPNPHAKEGDTTQQPLHARVVTCGTVSTSDLAKRVTEASSFTSADIIGCLQALKDQMVNYLQMGYNVELEGLGTFSLSLTSKPIMDKKQTRAAAVSVDSLNFLPCKELKRELQKTQLERSHWAESDPTYLSVAECEAKVFAFLEKHAYLTQSHYMNLCQCSKSKASLDLNRLVNKGRLVCSTFGRNKLYRKKQ